MGFQCVDGSRSLSCPFVVKKSPRFIVIKHVHILDPQLKGLGGHYLSHDTQLILGLKERGLPVSLYGRQGATVACAGVRATPVFSQDIFQEMAQDPQVWAIENFHNVNQAFLADLCRLPAERFGPDHLLYFPNLLQNQLYGLALWLARLPAERRPQVAIMLRYLNHAMDYVQQRANKDVIALYYRYGVQAMRNVQPASLICADTAELTRAYTEITGVDVLELPNPMDASALLKRSSRTMPGGRPTVVYQGHTSLLRGIHFLPEIIVRCRDLKPKPRFVIQLQNPETLQTGQLGQVLKALQSLRGPDVEIVQGALNNEAYLGMLGRADIVLLPYSPTFYRHGSSGVFTEAASVGKVVVTSPNTVPARQGEQHGLGVVAASDWTPAAMADAVASALSDLPVLKQRAEAGALAYRAEHCAKTLWNRIIGGLDREAACCAA